MSNKEEKSFFEELFNSIGQVNPELGDFEEISSILALPDDQFKIFSEIFLDELQKGLNNNQNMISILGNMSKIGSNAEELRRVFEEVIEQIDEQLTTLPKNKKDFLKRMMGIIINSVSYCEGSADSYIKVPIQLCNENAKIPSYANLGDAGLDIYAIDDFTINPGETKLIPTGIKMAIPRGYELQVRDKSGLALKTKLRVANAPGTIDSGYRDEIKVIVENIEPEIKDIGYEFLESGEIIIKSIVHGSPYYIEKGSKFAQLVLNKIETASFIEVDDIKKIEGDRNGGFGSTGLK